MVSISKGSAHGRRHTYRYAPQLFFGAIGVIALGCFWLMLVQTSKLNNVGPLPYKLVESNAEQVARKDSNFDANDQVKFRAKMKAGNVRRNEKSTALVEKNHAAAAPSVICGGHSAPSCQECPQGHGADWCNGECFWCGDKEECMSKSEHTCPRCQSKATNEASCNRLQPQCSWCEMTNQCMDAESICPKEKPWAAPGAPNKMLRLFRRFVY